MKCTCRISDALLFSNFLYGVISLFCDIQAFTICAVASCTSTMHRAYQPIVPAANLYLQDKWDRNRYETHRKKVAMAVPAVDTKGSETPEHLLVNMKKIQMNKELQSLIEKQNLMHSKKLSAIHQSHGRVDNWNFYPQRSNLNAAHQRQNVNMISYENGNILERILRRESEYGRWESEWEKVKRIQANISRYPQVTRRRGASERCTDQKEKMTEKIYIGRDVTWETLDMRGQKEGLE
ncbi:sperm axonemal maintenance protein CFAP97D1-like [Bufo gargarizans]|uniref:sperm axonemal maintenance protein CFAP97D1-like n=1 Tax=Bufo gargarizans TaxID=30331 RepID=UPI001CF38D58|nr:sperm axonemal maintenance protein CFAP97D1-like [Bufo gargarizans]